MHGHNYIMYEYVVIYMYIVNRASALREILHEGVVESQ